MIDIEKYDKCVEAFTQGMSLTKIAKEFHVNRTYLRNYILDKGFEIHNTHNESDIYSDIFEVIDTEEKAYWLGFLYADGSLYYNDGTKKNKYIIEVTLKKSDKDHLEKLKTFLNARNKISPRKKTNAFRLMITNKKMYYDLIKQGCHPRKSLDMTFPSEEIVPHNLLRHFLRGYVDGDGYIGIDFISRKDGSIRVKGRMSITCGDANFIYDLIKAAQWPEMTLQEDKRSSAKSMEWTGEKCFNILTFLYEDTHIYLDRKYEKYIELKDAHFNQES